MAVTLLGDLQPLEVCFAWETGSLPERVHLRDIESARSFLSRLSARGHTASLRRLADPPASRPRDDAELIAHLSALIAAGKLIVRRGPPVRLPTFDVVEDEPAPASRPVMVSPVVEDAPPPPPEEALPPVNVDALLQAAALVRAAEKGIPFCEECERKARKKPPEDDLSHLDQVAMARTLVRAAEEGVPVCEECEKQKKAPPPPPPDPEDEEDEDDEDDEDDAPAGDGLPPQGT
ncbi:MAG: hypothetical protein R3B70_25385 [Polyangiaceae bacterium]